VSELTSRLEMLIVLRWLDQGPSTDEPIRLSLQDAAEELELPGGREAALDLLRSLGELEERGALSLSWAAEPGAGRTAEVALSAELRADARRLFGRD
jgi:hypothetical protein